MIDYEKAVALDPEDAIAFNNKGLIEEKLGHKKKSNESFDKSNEVMGYEPKLQKAPEKAHNVIKQTPPLQLTRLGIIKSVFTKDGFKEFKQFSRKLFSSRKYRHPNS